MTYEQIEQANKKLKLTDIKGKDYAEVAQRIKAFRSICPNGTIITEMISNNNGVCVFKATVMDGDTILGTGTAYEKESSSYINKTSYIENCETSAVGRALGMCGFGDTSVASAEEVANAIAQQEQMKKPAPKQAPKKSTPREKLLALISAKGLDINVIASEYGLSQKSTDDDYNKVIKALETQHE